MSYTYRSTLYLDVLVKKLSQANAYLTKIDAKKMFTKWLKQEGPMISQFLIDVCDSARFSMGPVKDQVYFDVTFKDDIEAIDEESVDAIGSFTSALVDDYDNFVTDFTDNCTFDVQFDSTSYPELIKEDREINDSGLVEQLLTGADVRTLLGGN